MADHPIEGLMRTAMENIKQMVDVNTIVGDPVQTPDGSVILPVSKVGFGFAAGGSQFDTNEEGKRKVNDHTTAGTPEMPFGGGSGGGISITPVAFLVVSRDGVRSISLQGQSHLYERMLDMAPTVVEKIQSMFKQYTGQTMQNMQQAGMGAAGVGTAGMSNAGGMGTAGMGTAGMGTAGMGTAGMATNPVGTAGVGATGMAASPVATSGVDAAGMGAAGVGTTGMDVAVTQAADMQAASMQAAAQPQTTQHTTQTTQTTTETDTQ
jgi:sporulation protein YtfJ